MRIILTAPLSPFTGYGNDGIGLAAAIMEAGHELLLQPTAVDAPLPLPLAERLTVPLTKPFNLYIQHVDPGSADSTPERLRATGCNILWTMWEYSTFDNVGRRADCPENMTPKEHLRDRLSYFDAIFGYDTVTCRALQELGLPESVKIIKQQGGFIPDNYPISEHRDSSDEVLRFCMVGQLHERKDPFVAIEAFNRLKTMTDFPVELHLKTTVPGLHSAMEDVISGLKIHYISWQHEQLLKFYDHMHVLLAPSRGEGKNMPALEFMATGGNVIATNWGGHTEWLPWTAALPIEYELRPVDTKPEHANCINARASADSLAQQMLWCVEHRGQLPSLGLGNAELVRANRSWPAVLEKIMLSLKVNGARNGGEIYDDHIRASGTALPTPAWQAVRQGPEI